MRIPFKMLTLLLVCFLSCGFTHKAKNDEYPSKHHISAQNHAEKNQHSLVRRAHRAVGTPYVFGGESLAGFDCSGLVRWTYKSVGINLPRTAREQSLMGYRIMDVSKMRAGDIVAFRRSGGGYHTGIYIGDGRFIHAPRTNSRVRVESCDSAFFRNNFIGARRIIMTGSNRAMTEVAELEDMDRPSRQSVRRGHGRSVKHGARRTRSSKASRSHRRSKRR